MGAWMGLHQPSSGVLTLSLFTFLPFSLESMVMVAAPGRLVCFQKLPPGSIFDPAAYVSSHGASLQPPKPYRTYDFIICNPLTKKWRRLPSITPIAANISLLKLLVADPKNYSQEYDFLLLGREISWKYSSSQHTWESGDHRHWYGILASRSSPQLLQQLQVMESSWMALVEVPSSKEDSTA